MEHFFAISAVETIDDKKFPIKNIVEGYNASNAAENFLLSYLDIQSYDEESKKVILDSIELTINGLPLYEGFESEIEILSVNPISKEDADKYNELNKKIFGSKYNPQ